ncbi:uncharacterized protein [Danio rerio]|uniref:Uncharacterized protein n=2 Tax=Danio rerio TaxID=7955 RepID=A0AC58JNK7_DANRE|nr:uncharacterized protein si:ch211-12e13.10 [Danio rerio]XP_021329684.1 uncharacterized protein si:ch211-12e13.10 [Danio rerio]XP_021332073.1 uncharacterized protein si:ch211-12e13.10 [Danio rerio]|eukprot:XP_001336319.1 uncharacterized protein si:ch211-12e13.10 [Danio rerio]
MKNFIIFVSLLCVTLGFPVGSPLYKRERRRRQLGFGYDYGYGYRYGPVYPYYNIPIYQPNDFNDITPEIYIGDDVRRPATVKPPVTATRRPAMVRPPVTATRRLTTALVKPVPFNNLQPTGEPCPQPRGDDLNNDQLPVFVYVDPKEWSSMGAVDRPVSPGQTASSDLQPAFAIVPGVFLPTSENGQTVINPMEDLNNRLKTPDMLRVAASAKKEKDC